MTAAIVLIVGIFIAGVVLIGVREWRARTLDVNDSGFKVSADSEKGSQPRISIRNSGSKAVRVCAGEGRVCATQTDMKDLARPGRVIEPGASISVDVPTKNNQTIKTRITIVGATPAPPHPDAVLVVIDGPGK